MRASLGLAAAISIFALAGCTTTILETRRNADAEKPTGTVLVLAHLPDKYRSAVEDAIARQIPSAVAAHRVVVEETDWKTVVVFRIVGQNLREPAGVIGVDEAGVPIQNGIPIATLDVDVSVVAVNGDDEHEIYGFRFQRWDNATQIAPPTGQQPRAARHEDGEVIVERFAAALLPGAAKSAGETLAKSGLFAGAEQREKAP